MSSSGPHISRLIDSADLRLSFGQQFALALLTLAIWGATHRYSGIWHDGVLYAGQALNRLYPERFVGDLFFAYGSQDKFSAFGPLYAGLVRVVGINLASLMVTIFAQCAWLVAAAVLARRVLPGSLSWMGLLAIAALPRVYGADEVFAYAETFATARVLAEPLVLGSLAFLFGGRSMAGSFLLLGAALIHPVMAFPGIAAAFAMQMSFRAVLVASAFALLSIPLLTFGIPGMGESFRLMDPLWYEISMERSPFVFFSRWDIVEFGQPAVWAATLFLAAMLTRGVVRKFWFSVLYAASLGFALAFMGEHWPIALLVQMQPWRSAWLLQVCGILAAIWVIHELWSQERFGRLALVALATFLFAGGAVGAFACALLAALYPVLVRWQPLIGLVEKHYHLLSAGFIFAALPEILIVMRELHGALRTVLVDAAPLFPNASSVLVPEQPRVFWLALAAVSLVMIQHGWRSPAFRALALLTVVLTLLVSVLSWDALLRPAHRSLVRPDEPPGVVREMIPPGSLTYMEGGHAYLWFVLGRPSYASHHQAAGVIFSRRTALEAKRRLNAIALLGASDGRLQWNPLVLDTAKMDDKEQLKWIPSQALVSVCQDPILDYAVLRRPLRGDPTVQPFATISLALHRGGSPVTFYVFECRRLRR